MTVFLQFSFAQANKKESKKTLTMNALALMVFVLLFFTSTLVHADHLIEQTTDVEQSECYICHQGVDTPPELPTVQIIFVASYCHNSYNAVTAQFKVNNFVQPQLRAPPVFQ